MEKSWEKLVSQSQGKTELRKEDVVNSLSPAAEWAGHINALFGGFDN
jgi:hypothetical protein